MYSVEDQRFACSTGCKTPTIDSAFPNREHLYSEEVGNWTAEIDILLPPIKDTISYFFSSFFGNPVGFDDLNEHAQNMEVLVVPYLRSDVTILTNDVREDLMDCLKNTMKLIAQYIMVALPLNPANVKMSSLEGSLEGMASFQK